MQNCYVHTWRSFSVDWYVISHGSSPTAYTVNLDLNVFFRVLIPHFTRNKFKSKNFLALRDSTRVQVVTTAGCPRVSHPLVLFLYLLLHISSRGTFCRHKQWNNAIERKRRLQTSCGKRWSSSYSVWSREQRRRAVSVSTTWSNGQWTNVSAQ